MRTTHVLSLLLAVGSTFVVLGCVSAEGTAQTRAANDFACPESQVTVSSIGGTSYRAVGCGKTTIYTCAASDGSRGSVTAYACRPESAPQSTAVSAPEPQPAH